MHRWSARLFENVKRCRRFFEHTPHTRSSSLQEPVSQIYCMMLSFVESTVRFELTRGEPGGFANRCLRPLGYVDMWMRETDSNRWPPGYEPGALTMLSYPALNGP